MKRFADTSGADARRLPMASKRPDDGLQLDCKPLVTLVPAGCHRSMPALSGQATAYRPWAAVCDDANSGIPPHISIPAKSTSSSRSGALFPSSRLNSFPEPLLLALVLPVISDPSPGCALTATGNPLPAQKCI